MVRVSDILQITTIVVLFLLHYTLFSGVDASMRPLLAFLSATSLPAFISYTVMLLHPVEKKVKTTLVYEATKAAFIYAVSTAAGLLAS